MRLPTFFATHPVFTTQDVADFLAANGTGNPATRRALLSYHQERGHVLKVRRGLYAAVPLGADAHAYPVDPYLVAGRMTPDAVLAYHTALEVQGVAHSVHERFTYLTSVRSVRAHEFRGMEFKAVLHPAALRRRQAEMQGVTTLDRRGMVVRVTTLERTVVDVLDRLDLAGGRDEVWESLHGVQRIDGSAVADYALRLGNTTTVARVGFFLERHRDALDVDAGVLERLRAARPRYPARFDPDVRETVRLVAAWNLLVPTRLGDEVSEDLA